MAMTIRFSKRFRKQYQVLPKKLQTRTDERLLLWERDPASPVLRTHRLQGKLARYHSINITGDVRALYEVIDSEVYVYEMIGTHSQLYR